jgi:hypothetical protein
MSFTGPLIQSKDVVGKLGEFGRRPWIQSEDMVGQPTRRYVMCAHVATLVTVLSIISMVRLLSTLNEFYGTIDSVRRGRGRKTRGEPVSFAVSFWVDIETATQGMVGGSGCPLLGRH